MTRPTISVIIPVLGEGDAILPQVLALEQVAGPIPYEVLVVDGDPQGSTIAQIPKLPKVSTLTASQGRGFQLNAGARQAQGEILLFLHADAQLPPGAFSQICALVENPTDSNFQFAGLERFALRTSNAQSTCKVMYVGGAFDLAIDSPRWTLQVIANIASWRSRLTRIPYGDQGIFLRRTYFEALGGYPEIPIMEDVALMTTIKHRGDRLFILSERVRVSPRRWEQEGILYCTLRNWILRMLYALGVSPHRLATHYRSIPASSGKVLH